MVVVVLVVASALLIHSCDVSQTNNSLKTYAGRVSQLVTKSVANGQSVFTNLKSGAVSTRLTALENDLTTELQTASSELTAAQDLSAPSAMSGAQQNFVTAMRLRYRGISEISSSIQGVVNSSTAVDSVQAITAGASMLYASDVLYKTSVVTGIAEALNAANLPIGGTTGVNINPAQVVSDLGWLNSTSVAIWLSASVPSSKINSDQPGLHGHSLNYVTVNGSQLSTYVSNVVKASPAPTFVLNVTNGGQYNELDVKCKVWIKGQNDSGSYTIPETMAGQTTTCSVTLQNVPAQGSYTVEAEVVKVPGEKDTANNFLKFAVTFN